MATATVMQSNFNGGELSPLMDARIDQSRYANGCRVLRNMYVHPHGPATRRSGFRFICETKFSDRKSRLLPFSFSVEQSFVLEVGHLYVRVHHSSWEEDVFAEVSTPWSEDDLDSLKFCQSADVLYIVSPEHPPKKLCRYGNDDWRVEPLVFGSGVIKPKNVTAVASEVGKRVYSYMVTAVHKDTGEESLPSPSVLVSSVAELSVSKSVTITWDALDEDYEYRVYKCRDESGSYGHIGNATNNKLIDRGAVPNYDEGPPEIRNPFKKAGEYPSVVQFFQQRLCFAGSCSKPQTVWASRSGNYENLNISNPLRSDDAITATIAADRVNAVQWMMPGKQLLIGTVGGEWVMGGANGEPLSPMSVELQRQTVHGSADVMPVVIGSTVLFVQRCGTVVREFCYSLEADGYAASDLSVLSQHMIEGSAIKEWAYQQAPQGIVWCVLEDGRMVAFTYEREHKVVGWHRHDTDGKFESVCCIPCLGGDELWGVIRRKVDGQWKRYIELLHSQTTTADVRDAFFVDCGKTITGSACHEVTGLRHLEGRKVAILADGWVHPSQIVKNGKILLEHPASIVHVGLPYASDLSPMKLEISQQDGTAQARTKRVSRVWVRLHKSLALKVGTDEEHLDDIVFRKGSDQLGKALPLFSGEVSVSFSGGYLADPAVFIRQDQPLPMTVLALTAQVEVGDR